MKSKQNSGETCPKKKYIRSLIRTVTNKKRAGRYLFHLRVHPRRHRLASLPVPVSSFFRWSPFAQIRQRQSRRTLRSAVGRFPFSPRSWRRRSSWTGRRSSSPLPSLTCTKVNSDLFFLLVIFCRSAWFCVLWIIWGFMRVICGRFWDLCALSRIRSLVC